MIPLITIDGPSTKDIDDAIWIERTGTGYVVTVAIADVASVVLPESPEDLNAMDQAETNYFATGNSPMLPRHLSEKDLSLWPWEKRSAIVADIAVQRDMSSAIRVRLDEIQSMAKLDYADVPRILDGHSEEGSQAVSRLYPTVAGMIKVAAEFAERQLTHRRDAGALALYDLHEGWMTTEDGGIRKLKDIQETMGQVIVQEFMILANMKVAEWAIEQGIPILFRNHVAKPAADRGALLEALSIGMSHPIRVKTVREQIRAVVGRADYGPTLRGHWGLNLPFYTHFTSPIRRYADLVNHRQIRSWLLGNTRCPYPMSVNPADQSTRSLEQIAEHINAVIERNRDEEAARYKARAEEAAERHVESPRRLDALDAKGFERVVKNEVRGGADPSPVFATNFKARCDENRMPLICMAVLFMSAPLTPAWRYLRLCIVESCKRRPYDAPSLFATACSLGSEWPALRTRTRFVGNEAAPIFAAEAFFQEGKLKGEAQAPSKRYAMQLAAVDLLEKLAGADARAEVTGDVGAVDSVEPVPAFDFTFDESRDPVAVLHEYAQHVTVNAPTFEFEQSGPSHAPKIDCVACLGALRAESTGLSKREAKKLAAQKLIIALRSPTDTPRENRSIISVDTETSRA